VSAHAPGAVRTLLLKNQAVAALVGESIFGEIDEDQAKLMPATCIVLKPAGGPRSPGGGYQQFGKTRLDVDCYGSTLNESYLVYLAIYDALKGLTRQVVNGVLLHNAEVESKGSTARDPFKQWPVTFSSWLIAAAEIPAA